LNEVLKIGKSIHSSTDVGRGGFVFKHKDRERQGVLWN
jgi:hypothetical protein